ncbi:MAG: lytic transglycosylase [Desulfobulbus propionicus]|nr:MAG: lytic transglycosylase [Desulfobulbus propionicus]
MRTRLPIICLYLLLAVPAAVFADLYSYVDSHGIRHYTNVPGDQRYQPLPPLPSIGTEAPKRSGRALVRRGKRNMGARSQYEAKKLAPYINRAARQLRMDPLLIRAVIKTESNFNRYAVSSKGAHGLMQLMPGTARELNVHDPFDPWQNIYGGSRYLRALMDTYNGDVTLGLAAYNAGPGRVKPGCGLPAIPETRRYVAKVMNAYRAYKRTHNMSQTSISLREMVTIN